MPTYAYACKGCGPFDAMRSIAQRDRPVDCPRCGAIAPRMLSAPRLARGGDASGAAGSQGDGGSYQRMRHAAGCACC